MDQSALPQYLAVIKDRDMITALENDLRTATRFYGLTILYIGATHDLRGPLNNMVVYLELLKQAARRSAQRDPESEESASQRKYIEMIQQSIYSLNSYVQALLDLTAPAKDVTSEMDVGQALTEIAGLLRAPSKLQGVTFDWQLPDKPLRVMGQPVQLRQALLNIIINALEAMPAGGPLTVRSATTDDRIDIEICDRGTGIPEALQKRIFDMHFSTKEGRTGIGLYVARSIIQEHGGTLQVQSKLGAGSCFQVCLPLVVAVAPEATH
jgi:signal transduction histidine kinase